MAKEKIIQIAVNETDLFVLSEKGDIFRKRIGIASEWIEIDSIENFKKKEDNKPKTP